jgi:hypothetical protein
MVKLLRNRNRLSRREHSELLFASGQSSTPGEPPPESTRDAYEPSRDAYSPGLSTSMTKSGTRSGTGSTGNRPPGIRDQLTKATSGPRTVSTKQTRHSIRSSDNTQIVSVEEISQPLTQHHRQQRFLPTHRFLHKRAVYQFVQPPIFGLRTNQIGDGCGPRRGDRANTRRIDPAEIVNSILKRERNCSVHGRSFRRAKGSQSQIISFSDSNCDTKERVVGLRHDDWNVSTRHHSRLPAPLPKSRGLQQCFDNSFGGASIP